MSNVGDHFGLEAPMEYTNTKTVPQISPEPDRLLGLELEIENADGEWSVLGMNVTDDGSLRNNGLEFITKPSNYSTTAYTLTRFFNRIYTAEGEHLSEKNLSDRCSVHVHVNCQDLTLVQLTTLCMLYQVFESTLFNWIGDNRDKNIFCVPWSETNLTYNKISMLDDLQQSEYQVRSWEKYTALNLLPLLSLGTVEFRHMAGQKNETRILQWLRIILRLFEYTRQKDFMEVRQQIMGLNSTSQYKGLLEEVFKEEAVLLACDDYKLKLEEGVMNLKYAFMDHPKYSKKKKEKEPVKFDWNIAPTQTEDDGSWLFEMPQQTEPV